MPASARLPATNSRPEPYPGLRPYTEAQHDYFFGRAHDGQVLVDKILSNKLTLLFAASGVGKSSLLRAAVLPRLRHPGQENLDAIYYKDWVSDPFKGLKAKTLTTLKKGNRIEDDVTAETIGAESLNDFFQFCTLFTRRPLVIVLDQFEEFFQYQRHTLEFAQFVQQIAEMIVSQETSIALVISMREDFALELNAFKPYLPTMLFDNFYRLEKLTLAGARAAINEPVQKVGYQYDPKLLAALLKDLATREQRRDVGTPLAELMDTVEPPFLQIVCSQLWALEKDNPAHIINLKTYLSRGRASGLLKSYVDSIISNFNVHDKKIASLCFDHLASRRGTKIAYTAADLAPIVQVREKALEAVLRKLEKARLLRSQARGKLVWYELYHDLFTASIDEWNNAYKSQQRNLRAVIMAFSLIALSLLVYAAYDFGVNATHHHLRLSTKTTSNEIELFQGKAGSRDIFGLQRYIAQTGFQRGQIEPDKLFNEKPVISLANLDIELIETLPLLSRLEHYLLIGEFDRARKLARTYVVQSSQRAGAVIDVLGKYPSRTSIKILVECLAAGEIDDNLKAKMIQTLGNIGTPGISGTLIPILESPGTPLRIATLKVLGKLNDPYTVKNILEQLADQKNPGVQNAAVSALKQMRHPRVIAQLEEQLQDRNSNWKMRAQIAEIIGQFTGTRPAVILSEQLERENDPNVQTALIRALAKQRQAGTLSILVEFSKGTHPTKVRKAAVEALIQFEDPATAEVLLALLDDKDSSDLHSTAVKGLEKIADDTVVPTLQARLDTLDPLPRKEIIKLLGKHGDRSSVPFLVAELVHARDASLRSAAAKALGQLKDPTAVNDLARYLDDNNASVVEAVEDALVKIESPAATDALVLRLNNGSPPVRERIVDLLIKKNDASGVAAVFRLIEDSDDQIRSFVVRKFIEGRFYTYNRNLVATAAVMVLIERLGDPIWYVRYNAMMALAWGNHHRLFDLSDLDDQSRQRAVQAAKRNLDDDNPLFQGQPIGRDNRDRLEWAAIDAMAALDDPYGIELLIEVRDGKRLPGYRKDARKLIDGLIRDPQALITLVSRLKALEPDFRANVIISMNAYEGLMLGPDQLSLVSDLVSDEDPEVRTQISNLLIRHRYADGTPALINQLKEEQTPGVIVALASALRALANRDSATKVLIERLQDDDADIRVAVVQALGATGGVLAMEALERTLKDQDVQVRYASAEALGLRGKTEVVPLLIDYLNSLRQNYELADLWANQHLFLDKRTAMVKLLGTLGDPQAIAVLSEQLDEPRGDVAVAAVMALNQIGTAEAMEIILDGLNRRRKVAHACIKAITQWNNDEATEALISGLSSPDQMLRRDAAQALGQLGDPHAVPALIERLDDSHSGVQAAAIEALGTIGAPRALSPILQELKNPNSSVREAAVRALSDLGDPAVLPALRERIKDENTRVHITATTALGTLGDKNAVDLLVGNLGHRRNDVRAATAAALGQIGDKRAVEPLVAVLNDKTARIDVRAEALMAIGHIRAHQANGNHKFAYDHDHRLDRTISVIGREVRKALDQGRYSRGAVVTAAVSLMAFDPDESLALLQELIDHGNTKTKVSLAKRLGAFHTDAGAELLVSDLLPDHDPALRQQAIESLGRIKAERALPEIQRYLSNGDVAIRVAAAEALGRIASHEGIEPLKQVLMDQEAAVRVRLQACKALRQIGSRKALDSLFEALKEDKEDLLGAYVYYWLGGIPEKRQDVMAFMRERLEKIDRQYEQWRLVRDSEPAAAPKADQNDDGQHQASQPPSKWLFELGYGIAKLSPGEEGIQALQHNLTEVRLGAIAALGDTGDIAMLDNLIGQYDRIDQPLLRHATYRVMDGILATLQNNGTAANLQELKALRKMLSGKQDLEARLKWIINQAEEMDT